MIEPSDLKVGDILLLKDNTHNLYRHTSVVTEVDVVKNTYKVMHWRGIGIPYAITEVPLPTRESLLQRNVELECFRLKDQELALKAVIILRKWLTWVAPYDKNRLASAEAALNKFFGISSDLLNDKFPTLTTEINEQKISEHREYMERLFESHYMDVVKFSSRRNTSPVRPREDGSGKGFNCLQGILVAFQAAYAQDFVESITDIWLSNKNTDLNSDRASSKPIFNDASTALYENFDKSVFLANFPKFLKLYAKECSIDTFKYAMEKDPNIEFIGVLQTQTKEDTKPTPEVMDQIVIKIKEQGDKMRADLYRNVILPSSR